MLRQLLATTCCNERGLARSAAAKEGGSVRRQCKANKAGEEIICRQLAGREGADLGRTLGKAGQPTTLVGAKETDKGKETDRTLREARQVPC